MATRSCTDLPRKGYLPMDLHYASALLAIYAYQYALVSSRQTDTELWVWLKFLLGSALGKSSSKCAVGDFNDNHRTIIRIFRI
jgi:hypothetical protein